MQTTSTEIRETLRLAAAFALTALAVVFAMGAQPAPAIADDEAQPDSAASQASESADSAQEPDKPADAASLETQLNQAGDPLSLPAFGGLPMMGKDYVFLGRNLELGSHSFENDLLAAAQTVTLTDCAVSGSIRVAAQDVSVTNSNAAENITLAGQNVQVKNSTGNAVAAAGQTVTFSGTCNELTAFAENVVIDGTVNGDAVVGANTVELGPNAKIGGTIHVEASAEPRTDAGTSVGKLDFEKSKDNSISTANAGDAVAGFTLYLVVMFSILGAIGTFVTAILAEWLFKRHTAAAAGMIRSRTGATIGSGVVGALVAPIAVIILLSLGITLPVAGGVAFALFAMTAVAGGFAGASLFKLAFPRLSRYKCAMAGGAIVGAASAIPFLGSLVRAAAFVYFLGYVLQSIYLGMQEPDPIIPGFTPAPPPPMEGPTPGFPVTAASAAPVPPASIAPEPPASASDSVTRQ